MDWMAGRVIDDAGGIAPRGTAAAAEGSAPGMDHLHVALLDSRQRWRDLVGLAGDFAFETDAAGLISFASPANVLGWPAPYLLGQAAAGLLAPSSTVFDPFANRAAYRERRAWLRRQDGSVGCYSMSAAPLLVDGAPAGMRGIARDVTAQDAADASIAAALRRGEVLEHIMAHMRQEVLAPRMMLAVLEELSAAVGAAGALVMDLLAPDTASAVLHRVGAAPGPLLDGLAAVLSVDSADPVPASLAGQPVLCCPCYTRFGERAGLCVWRGPGGETWSGDDTVLASSATAIIRVVLEHEAIQRELARQARTDPLTGLLNRRAFVEDVRRRIDRLHGDEMPGTLIYVDVDRFKQVNDRCGHDTGDEALVQVASLLRRTVRPADLVARLGGDEFAIWMDTADELTAAERAERLRLDAPALLAAALPADTPLLSTSIGIAARHHHAAETLEDVMKRADAAMYAAKKSGGGHWRVSQAPAPL